MTLMQVRLTPEDFALNHPAEIGQALDPESERFDAQREATPTVSPQASWIEVLSTISKEV